MPQPRPRRRQLRELGVCSLTLVVAVMLGACTQPTPKPIPSAPSVVEPVFASDAEALAAAEAGYLAYQNMWSTVAQAGGSDPDRILPFVSPKFHDETLAELQKFLDRSVHSSGSLSFRDMNLQNYKDLSVGNAEVVAYACIDFSLARILDSDGADITPADRAEILPAQITMVSDPDSPQLLVYGGDEKWAGEDFCH